jgi:prepilin-type N-terminal cleavage/methylation domain-containing protein
MHPAATTCSGLPSPLSTGGAAAPAAERKCTLESPRTKPRSGTDGRKPGRSCERERADPSAPRFEPFHSLTLAATETELIPGRRAAPRQGGFFRRRPRRGLRGFTLVEVLAALLLMAIVVPVAMQGMSIATRAGVMGQRKAAAMRVADRVLNELIVTREALQTSATGTATEGDATYAWTLESQTWTEDAMLQLTVTVTFSVQGNDYTVSASTLFDPTAGDPSAEVLL